MRGKNILWLTLVAMLLCVPMVDLGYAQTTPTISLDPMLTTGYLPKDLFSVNIRITDADNVYAWSVEMKFAPYVNLLAVNSMEEGYFLQQSGEPTYFAKYYDAFLGLVKVGGTLVGGESGVSGSGTLATITFQVIEAGECPLELFNTELLDPALYSIDHTVATMYVGDYGPYTGYYYGTTCLFVMGKVDTRIIRLSERTYQTFDSKVKNNASVPLYARVNFHMTKVGTTIVRDFWTDPTYYVRAVNGYGGERPGWTPVGVSPYLNASDTSYVKYKNTAKYPTTESSLNPWVSPRNVFSSNNQRANGSAVGQYEVYGGFGFAVPAVSKVFVALEWTTYGAVGDPNDGVTIEVSNDGGLNYSPVTYTEYAYDTLKFHADLTAGVRPLDGWQRIDVTSAYAWTPADMSNIAVKVNYAKQGSVASIVSIDSVVVEAHVAAQTGEYTFADLTLLPGKSYGVLLAVRGVDMTYSVHPEQLGYWLHESAGWMSANNIINAYLWDGANWGKIKLYPSSLGYTWMVSDASHIIMTGDQINNAKIYFDIQEGNGPLGQELRIDAAELRIYEWSEALAPDENRDMNPVIMNLTPADIGTWTVEIYAWYRYYLPPPNPALPAIWNKALKVKTLTFRVLP